ncbi:hypothetical protein GCM10009640_04260 [Agrococcus citreus]|uniref:Uncharacterized protein n=1 Tax=Agrococcus citreus TaxID=84643 RepID=A0ABN1YNN7_9MICO
MPLVELAHVRLDRAHLVLDLAERLARHATDLVPAALDRQQRLAGGCPVGELQDRCGLLEERALRLEVGRVLLVLDGRLLGLRLEEDVAGLLELRPQCVVDLPTGAARVLPVVEQRAVRGDAVDALRRERLGLVDERLLARADVLVRGVEIGEEPAASTLEGGSRVAEALPERVGLALRQAGAVLLQALPVGEQCVDALHRLLPLDVLEVGGGELLDRLDDARALGDRLVDLCLARGLLLRLELAELAAQGVETGQERAGVADRVGARDGRVEVRGRLGDVAGVRAAADALLEQADLTLEVGELALEVAERLRGFHVGELADDAPGVAVLDRDGTGRVDRAHAALDDGVAERGALGGGRLLCRGLCRCCQRLGRLLRRLLGGPRCRLVGGLLGRLDRGLVGRELGDGPLGGDAGRGVGRSGEGCLVGGGLGSLDAGCCRLGLGCGRLGRGVGGRCVDRGLGGGVAARLRGLVGAGVPDRGVLGGLLRGLGIDGLDGLGHDGVSRTRERAGRA